MSRRKQSNPKPLKAGEEENWNEEDEKSGKTSATIEEVAKDGPEKEDRTPPPTTPPKPEEIKSIKTEPESEPSPDRVDVPETVIKKVGPSAEADLKIVSPPAIKNEPAASPVPSTASVNDQEYPALPQSLPSALTGTRYYPTVINAASDSARFRPETLDTRQGFLCPPCGIRFSSFSTLEAHQTFYCSHRKKKLSKGGTESEGEDGRSSSVPGVGYDQDDGSSGENMSTSEPSAKISKTGKQYRCTHCSYSADKKVSLNRHMRMHSVSPATSVQNDSDSSMPPVDRYCQECDIRFSNLKTFRAHKLHYCSTRNVIKRSQNANSSPSPNLSIDSRVTPPPAFALAGHTSPQPFVALNTTPVLIIPYALIQAGNVLPGSVSSGLSTQDGVYLMLPDGSIQLVAQAVAAGAPMVRTVEPSNPVLQPLLTPNATTQARKENISPKVVKPPSIPISNGALDLRTRRESHGSESTTTIDASEEEKENRLLEEHVDHEDIVCAPSIPLILSTSSTCSTPSPMPLSPESQSAACSRADKLCSPSPKSVITMVSRSTPTKKVANGVIQKCAAKTGPDIDEKKAAADAYQKANAISPERNSNYNLTEMLLAAAAQNPDSLKELPFPPEMIPHLTSIQQQVNSSKRPALNPIANIPLLLPPVSPGSRVIPDLLNPSILPLLTSELAMRLATSNVQPGVPSYIRQGTWKCDACNIGFCKYENYVAHKQHYCSTRKVPESGPPEENAKTSPIGSPSSKGTVSPQTLSKENTSPVLQPTNVIQNARPFSQFVCSMCGIKFTSLDNLTTHQTFYCPNRATVSDGEKSSLKCPKCKISLPLDQLPAHQCTGATSTGWKCPCCFVICSSTNAIQKHIESHNSVKAFLCTICNYKGNTIRGMRTHIRVHFDKRNGEITEENFITCVLDDSSSTVSSVDENSMDKTIKKSPPEVAPPAEEKVTETSCSPVVVENVEDEDEYIEVDELPNMRSNETLKSEGDDASNPKNERKSSSQETADEHAVNNNKKYDSKYCKSCDISFNYHSTFIAHKKYYCSSHSSDATSPLNGAESIVVPTNLATAAHIV